MGKKMSEEQLFKEINPWKNLPWLCITGGEPFLQDFSKLCELVKIHTNMMVSVETNGTLKLHPTRLKNVDVLTVSPKLTNSGMRRHLNPEALRELNRFPLVQFKFVCKSCADVNEALTLCEDLGIGHRTSITFQPEGFIAYRTYENYFKFFRELWEYVKGIQTRYPQYDLHVLPQLHRLVFGQKRGA